MARRSLLQASCLVAGLTLAAGASAAFAPSRTLTRAAPITALSMTAGTVVFAVGESSAECAHAEMWLPATRQVWRFGKPTRIPCENGASTGTGIAAVASSARRAVWLSYVGGNIREWRLWTATPTRRTPLQLRFVARDVEAPPPVVVGPGTPAGVPFAVDEHVVYLGDDGTPIFTAKVAAPVRLLAAGPGIAGTRVVAALSDGQVVLLSADGKVLSSQTYGPGEVRAVLLDSVGPIVQVGETVHVGYVTVTLPPGARLLDYAPGSFGRSGRLVYARRGQVWQQRIWQAPAEAGPPELLVTLPARPGQTALFAVGTGTAWASGTQVDWRGGSLPPAGA